MKQRLFLVFFTIILLLSTASPADAQQTLYDGLDIVFLVDQSGSMARINGGGIPNDRLGLRFYSLSYAASLLGDFHLYINQDASFRFSVVNFGRSAEAWDFAPIGSSQPIYWQTIEPRSRDEWKPQYDQLKSEFDEMIAQYSKKDLGDTNFQIAFREARTQFDQIPNLSGNRLRVIILLTDGQPALDVPGFTATKHMDDLTLFASKYFPEPNYRIYTIGMIDANDSYWQLVQHYWEEITNDPCTDVACPDSAKDRTGLVASNDDVGKRFQEILKELSTVLPVSKDLKYVDEAVIPGPLPVPPYLKSISFAYFKTDPSQKLLLTDPTGASDANISGVEIEGIDGPIQMVRISNPQPGQWKVATDPASVDVDITMRYIFAKSQLDSPLGPQAQYVPLTIKYKLLDDLGNPLPNYPDPKYRLLVRAKVEAGGQSWDLTLNSAADGTYSAEFTPIVSEPHKITVTAESQDYEGNLLSIFNDVIGEFDVSPVLLAAKNIPLVWPQYSEQPITFELQDSRGYAVEAPSSLDMMVTINGENSAPLMLKLQPDGSYETTYTPSVTGLHSIHAFASVVDSSGEKKIIMDENIGEFDVSPTTRVDLIVQEPASAEQYETGLLPFPRNPLTVKIQLQDEDGKVLDPQKVFLNSATNALSVTSIQDEKGNDVNLELDMQQTPDKGVYLAESSEFGTGEYIITVAGAELKPGFVYRNEQIRVRVVRMRHPWQIPLGILIFLAVIGTSSWTIVKNYRIRQHPCKGMIYIVDAYGTPKFQKRLDTVGKNTIIVFGKEISPLTHVKKMQFWCETDAQSRDGRVYVRVWLDNDRTPIPSIDGKIMSANSEVKIGRYAFWLLKDPEEMPDHPEAQEQESFS